MGEKWFYKNVLPGDTLVNEVKFIDIATNEEFWASNILISVPSGNTSAVGISFTRNGDRYSVQKRTTTLNTDLFLRGKEADKIFIKLGTAADSVDIFAW